MDLKTQQMIYALDALTVSVKLQRKLLGQLKALIAPKKVELRVDPQTTSIFTFEPPSGGYPPCLHCPDHQLCRSCDEKQVCDQSTCKECTYDDICGEWIDEE